MNQGSLPILIHVLSPTALSIDTLIARSVALSKAVKAVDPSAEILGYEAFGWMEYLTFDQSSGWDNYKNKI